MGQTTAIYRTFTCNFRNHICNFHLTPTRIFLPLPRKYTTALAYWKRVKRRKFWIHTIDINEAVNYSNESRGSSAVKSVNTTDQSLRNMVERTFASSQHHLLPTTLESSSYSHTYSGPHELTAACGRAKQHRTIFKKPHPWMRMTNSRRLQR